MTNTFNPRQPRFGREFVRIVSILAVAVFAVTLASAMRSGSNVSAAPINGGTLQLSRLDGGPLTNVGSAIGFSLTPPVGAACSGDSATGGYRVQSYMVPSSVDPSTLTYGLTGPLPTDSGAAFRQPLADSAGSGFINKTTAVTTGLLTGLPAFSFGWIGAGGATFLPPGTYNLGYACTKGTASATQLDKYWNVQFTFAADPNDVPSGITWSFVAGSGGGTTTTTSTTTTLAGSTTTTSTLPKSTTTTTTTTATAQTTTTSSTTSTTVAVRSLAGGSSGSGASGSGATALVRTGSSPGPILLWAILLLVLGRMAILFSRRIRASVREHR